MIGKYVVVVTDENSYDLPQVFAGPTGTKDEADALSEKIEQTHGMHADVTQIENPIPGLVPEENN